MGAANRKKIQDTIKELGKADAYEIHQGKVLSVDQDKLTMNVEVLELTFYDVRLRAVVTNDTGVWVIPKVGSFVSIGQIEGGVEHVLIRASEIDKLFIKIGGKTLELNTSRLLATYGNTTIELKDDYAQITSGSKKINVSNTAFVINNGSNGGLVKSMAVAQKLNALELQINQIKAVAAAIIAAAAVPGTPVTNGTLAAYFTAPPFNVVPIVPTLQPELENQNATH